jgi:folate-dependent phosphoribosylglycinamide formyltransferase PurN
LYLLNRSPDRGVAYEVVCAITSEPTFAEEVVVERRGIPTRPHSIADFCHARGASVYHDLQVRADYDELTRKMLAPFMPDLIVLDGYRYLVTAPLLDTYANRIINLHFSDLALRTPRGGPQYPGVRAVRDAIAAGCRETRASVHLVNDEPDDGSVIVRSWPFAVSPMVDELRTLCAPDALKAYVFAHEQWMMRTASGPLLSAALRLIATGGVDLDRLAAIEPRAGASWWLDPYGLLTTPELEFA